MTKWLDPRRYARRARWLVRARLGLDQPVRRPSVAYASQAAGMKIHVGAGLERLEGWLNTDITADADYELDATQAWPVLAGSVSHVYGDNFIEHLTLDQVRSFLHNALIALAPGGRIRLATPDVEAAAKIYLGAAQGLETLMERHRRNGYQVAHAVDVMRIVFAESAHWLGYMFDETSLRVELEAAGFVDVVRCHAGESDHLVLRGLESRTEPIEDRTQLVLEAVAPGGPTESPAL